jgi:hypothetical protein
MGQVQGHVHTRSTKYHFAIRICHILLFTGCLFITSTFYRSIYYVYVFAVCKADICSNDFKENYGWGEFRIDSVKPCREIRRHESLSLLRIVKKAFDVHKSSQCLGQVHNFDIKKDDRAVLRYSYIGTRLLK